MFGVNITHCFAFVCIIRSKLADSVAEYDIIRGCTFTGNRAGKCRHALYFLHVSRAASTKVLFFRPTSDSEVVRVHVVKKSTVCSLDRIDDILINANIGKQSNERGRLL